MAPDARTAITFALSPGHAHDTPEGRKLISTMGQPNWPMHLLMDRADEGVETRQLALDLGFIPVVPPKSNRVEPWDTTVACIADAIKSSAYFVGSKDSHLLQVRETRCDVHGLDPFRAHHRRSAVRTARSDS